MSHGIGNISSGSRKQGHKDCSQLGQSFCHKSRIDHEATRNFHFWVEYLIQALDTYWMEKIAMQSIFIGFIMHKKDKLSSITENIIYWKTGNSFKDNHGKKPISVKTPESFQRIEDDYG
jgi:hypothetical protein